MGELSDNLSKQAVMQRGPRRVNRNPVAQGLNVTVSIPETIEIRMVEASALADYEMWFFLASVLANAVVGFGVAYYQDQAQTYLLSVTIVFNTVDRF